jgi:hypothetical protein
MKPEDVLAELRACTTNQIGKEHEFRLEYLRTRLTGLNANPRSTYFQLERSALWLSLYSHVNWLTHFKFLKHVKVDALIPKWLEDVFGWPQEHAEAFWYCGRNPIAHTGSQNLPYSLNIQGAKRYIQLSFDSPGDWEVAGEYMSLPKTSARGGAVPTQQTIYFYQPIENRLTELAENVYADIATYNHPELLRLRKVMMAFNFFADDGSLARMNNLLDVYEHVKA